MNRRETTYLRQPQVKKTWKLVNAEGVPLGRIATEVAQVLMGKHKPEYTPHIDSGDYVVIINADKVYMTGNKGDQKTAWHYTGYPSGRKTESYNELKERAPERLFELAIRRMLPKNRIGRVMLGNLRIVKGDTHPFAAHNPVEMKIER